MRTKSVRHLVRDRVWNQFSDRIYRKLESAPGYRLWDHVQGRVCNLVNSPLWRCMKGGRRW